jgi:hypothetical protein
MGREVKRVATDFQWPLNKVWQGYLNPFYDHAHKCAACGGGGYSKLAKLYQDQWYGNAEFDAVKYGSTLMTTETPAVKRFVELQVDRSIREAAEGTAMELEPGPGFKVKRNGTRCFYTDNGRYTRDEAILIECNRLIDIFNYQWCHHLNEEDVKALIDADRLWDFTHRPLPGIPLEEYIKTRAYFLWIEAGKPESDGKEFWEKAAEEHSRFWLPFSNGYIPTPEEVNAWSIGGFGHDSSNAHTCVKSRCRRENHEYLCDVCQGEGRIWQPKEAEQWAKEWEKEEPPAGEGYQIWETASEGSPISPVFSDPRILAEWMSNSPPWGAGETMSADRWLKWITGPGWAMSGMIVNGVYKSGVEAMTE